jgi:hypothetical protein
MNKISIYRGDDDERTLVFTDGDGAVIDITGWKIYFTVKAEKDDSDDAALLKIDWESHSDPTQGESLLTQDNADTDMIVGTHVCDIQIKDDTGKIKTLVVMPYENNTDIKRRNT